MTQFLQTLFINIYDGYSILAHAAGKIESHLHAVNNPLEGFKNGQVIEGEEDKDEGDEDAQK